MMPTFFFWSAVLMNVAGAKAENSLQHCSMASDPNQCAISSLALPSFSALVYPGGNTRCAYEDQNTLGLPKIKSEYYFQVQRGSGNTHDNVLLYFQSGGGCTSTSQCSSRYGFNKLLKFNPKVMKSEGVFDDAHVENPFRGWTKVMVLYCTGDIHVGNAVYQDEYGSPIIAHNGMNNTNAVLSWLYQNFPTPAKLVLAGCSAGSLGVQLFAPRIRRHYAHVRHVTVLADSYAGYLTPRAMEVMRYWNACSDVFGLSQETLTRCREGLVTYPDIIKELQAQIPSVPYAFIQSKGDFVQRAFLCIMEQKLPVSFNMFVKPTIIAECFEQPPFYQGVITTLRSYQNKLEPAGNQITSFIMNGQGHCFLHKSNFYTAKVGSTRLVDWVMRLVHVRDDDDDDINDDQQNDVVSTLRAQARAQVVPSVCEPGIAADGAFDESCDVDLSSAKVNLSTLAHRHKVWLVSLEEKDLPRKDDDSKSSWWLPRWLHRVWHKARQHLGRFSFRSVD